MFAYGTASQLLLDAPFPEGAKTKRTFKWCDTIPGEWSPPKFGDDVLIKVGWTVILDENCLETEKGTWTFMVASYFETQVLVIL